MYNLGFIMGVTAILGALLIYNYRVEIWAWVKEKVLRLKAKGQSKEG